MDQFIHSCRHAENYPTNLVCSRYHAYELQEYLERFTASQRALCYAEKDDKSKDWGIHVWECNTPGQAFIQKIIDTQDLLQSHFGTADTQHRQDPKARYVFLHAKNARDRLNTTTPMLQTLLSHHQVNAAAIDQLLSYGRRKNEQDFSACAFRSEARLSQKHPGLALPELCRSGRQFELCYTLRTIEDPKQWTMRQAATYHSFDIVTGRAFWLVIKASPNVRERLQETTGNSSALDTTSQCLDSALTSHLVMCKWANGNWRAYIGELEVEVHKLTKKATTFEAIPAPTVPTETNTASHAPGPRPASTSLSRRSTLQRAGTFLAQPFSRRQTAQVQQASNALQDVQLDHLSSDDEDNHFSIEDMQTIQTIEEKINTALLVLRTNHNTIDQLRNFYCTIQQFEGWPCDLAASSNEHIVQFAASVANIETDLRLQQARLETLVRLLADRKALLYAIIENRNAESNKLLAQQSQHSQEKMEQLTSYMSILAEKTQQETVSMRIITLVTLFFLPGTFISVSRLVALLPSTP